ncbi:MAG: hypothetical protein NT096_07800 [Proteobacteria bacterium]|nr:hypothetical protein [Pseudomonadota bacterium]
MVKIARQGILRFLLLMVIPLLFLSSGHLFVLQRTLHGPTPYLTIRGDTLSYVRMMEENFSSPRSPFRYRVLTPFIARMLPFSPTESLRIVSYLSLYACYLFILLTCLRLGISMPSATVGLLAVFVTPWHLYCYHNPFLTDAFQLMIISVMIFSLVCGYFSLFAPCAILGVLGRETTVFLVPVWFLTRDRSRGCLLLGVAVAILLLLWYVMRSNTSTVALISEKFNTIGIFRDLYSYGTRVMLSWNYAWVLSLIGMWLIPGEYRVSLITSFLLLISCAFLTSLIATDTGRMFAILAPVLAIFCAQLCDALKKSGHTPIIFSIVAISMVAALVSLPNVILGEQRETFQSFQDMKRILLTGVMLGFYILFILQDQIQGRAHG